MLALSNDGTPPFLELLEAAPVDWLVPVVVYAVEGRGAMLGVGVEAGDVPVVVPLISTERDRCQIKTGSFLCINVHCSNVGRDHPVSTYGCVLFRATPTGTKYYYMPAKSDFRQLKGSRTEKTLNDVANVGWNFTASCIV